MLESLAATLLNRVLGSYVENFDPAQLNVGIWSGDVQLKNLKLRKDCLDQLHLPIDVKFGILGELVLNVPWSSLKNKPVKIVIQNCFLLCSPTSLSKNARNEQDKLERELRLKLRKLMEWEMANKARNAIENPESVEKNETFMQSLITKIIDNLQVEIKGIHIRYEDVNCNFSKVPASIGLTLNELSAVSTDSQWKPSFIEITQTITHKLLTLNSLGLYWNTEIESFESLDEDGDLDEEQLIETFKKYIASQSSSLPNNQYLLNPVSGLGKLSINKLGTTEQQANIELEVLCDEFGIELDDSEYADILHTISSIKYQGQTEKFKLNKPMFAVSDNPSEWFEYIARCVLNEVREKNRMWTWDNIKDIGHKRREYIELWIKKLKLSDINEDLPSKKDNERLRELHIQLDFDSITLFRSIAKRKYAQMRLQSQDLTPPPTASKERSNGNSWLSSWWGPREKGSNPDEDLVMSEEQRKELYDAIEFHEVENTELLNVNTPMHLPKIKIRGILQKGYFALKKRRENISIGEIIFEGCEVNFMKRPESFLATFTLQDFKLENGFPDILYKHIITPKEMLVSKVNGSDADNHEFTPRSEALFYMAYESNPLDGSADRSADIKLLGTTVFFHTQFVREIIRFFKTERQHFDTINSILSAAEATVEGWTAQTRMGIESLLEEHKTFNLKLDLQTPLIIIPVDPTIWDSPCAIIDAGHISVNSEVIPREKIDEIREMSVEEYDQINGSEINRLMFDRFNIEAQDTQILLAPTVQSALESINTTVSSRFSILEKMRLEIVTDVSIIPKAFKLPKVRIYAHLPKLALSLNDYQYKIMMLIIRNCIDSFINHEEDGDYETPQTYMEDPVKIQNYLKQTVENLEKVTELEMLQHIFELQFDVDNVQLSVLKCTDKNTMEANKLIDILGNTFKFNIIKQMTEMDVQLIIHSLRVEDYIENSEVDEFKRLITSNMNDTDDLFSLEYKRMQRIVNHKGTFIEVIDQNVDLHMTKLKLVLTPKSILTLMNYAILTFTNPEVEELPQDVLKHNNEDTADSPQKMKVKIDMEGLIVVLNDDSVKLATFELSAGQFLWLLLPERMKINLRLDGLDLTDEIAYSTERDSVFRKLISMDGKQLVEFSYETFDLETNTNDYDSFLKCTTGSMFVNYNSEATSRILKYFLKLQKMKTYFDRAREAAYNQAPSIEAVRKMKLDMLIKAPIFQFSKSNDNNSHTSDIIRYYLGEIFVENNFSGVQEEKINHIKVGFRDGEVSSSLNLKNGLKQELFMASNMCLVFKIDHNLNSSENIPEFNINGTLEPLSLNVTELQLKYLSEILNSFKDIFDISDDIPITLSPDNLGVDTPIATYQTQVSKENEIASIDSADRRGKSCDINFNAPNISLTLYDNTTLCTQIRDYSITTVSLQEINIAYSANRDGTSSGLAHITAFNVEDTRNTKDNKHTELIPKIKDEKYQFVANLSRRWVSSGLLTNISLTINSPRFILAIDHMVAVKKFFDILTHNNSTLSGSDDKKIAPVNSEVIDVMDGDEKNEGSNSKLLQYSLNIVDSAIIILADPSEEDSEAVVFSVGQILFTEQNLTSLSTNNIGVFLTKMNSSEDNKIRLLDDFSASVNIDRRNSTVNKLLTEVHASIEPILMRISLRDIRLAMLIFNKAVSLLNIGDSNKNKKKETTPPNVFSKEFEKKLAKYAPSLVSTTSINGNELAVNNDTLIKMSDIVLKGETLNADFGGFRVILLGDVHEMPILDMKIGPFTVKAKDWSHNLDGVSNIETSVNVFNYSRSSWEPLFEPTDISFHISKGPSADSTFLFDVITTKLTELTLSSRSIALLSNIPNSLSDEIKLVPRGSKKPYLLINDTGLDLDVWIKPDTDCDVSKKNLLTLKAGESEPWEFEDWKTVRERLDTDSTSSLLSVATTDETYATVLTIDATYEGELLHVLRPPIDHVHRRIVCDLKCNDENVKVITFRSTLLLENTTCNSIEVKVVSQTNESVEETILYIKEGKSQSVPVEHAYDSRLYFRPVSDVPHDWSDTPVTWRELLTEPLSLHCTSEQNPNDIFYMEINGKYNHNEPLAKIFPHMKITISPSLIVENLLPCGIDFCIFGKREEMKKYKHLEKAGMMSVHDVSLDEFLLLSVQPNVERNPTSKPSIINTPQKTALEPEQLINITTETGQKLQLKIHYKSIEGSRAKVLRIYSPYIIMNSTGRDLYIEGSDGNISVSKVIVDDNNFHSLPLMFSFEKENERAKVKFKETEWSMPVSFDAIGQSFDVTVNNINRSQESNLGINISEGLGKYGFCKFVKISPRYIVCNYLETPIEITELGSTDSTVIVPEKSIPMYKLRNITSKQMMIKMLGSTAEWSSPFCIKDIGITFVKILTETGTHRLIKLEILLENATIFVRIKDGGNNWPYSIRNFSDHEFIFYQRDIKIVDDSYEQNEIEDGSEVEFKPLYYRVPPKSVMPYAWDYPTARQKKIIITSRGRKREITLAEIGNMKPMRIPSRLANERTFIVDLNVVADGPTQALLITNYDPRLSLYKMRDTRYLASNYASKTTLNSSNDLFEVNEEDKNVLTRVIIAIKGVGISLVNNDMQELAYVSARGLEFHYNDSDLYKTFSWKVKWLQVDNQLYGGVYQNVIYPAAIPHTTKELENHPVISGSVSRLKDDSYGVPYYKHATFLLQEFAFQLDEDFVYALINFMSIPDASWQANNKEMELDDIVELPKVDEMNLANDIYFEMFHIQPTLLHLSFVRTERISENGNDMDRLFDNYNALSSVFFMHVLTMTIGNVNDAPIKLNSLLLNNVRVPLMVLLKNIKTHYSQQFFYQIHIILGSADFLGNPVGLFNNISSGVWDLFYEPYQGYMLNDRPSEIGIHIAKGGLSFAKKTVFGLSDSMAKFTGSVAKGLSVTQDTKFQENRRLQQRINNNNRNVFTNSAQSFANAVGSGISGLALDPLRGSQTEGTSGFFKGLGKGLIGLPTKTAIGLLDLTNNLSQGVKTTTTALDQTTATRARLPRYIGQDKIIKSYNLRDSQGQFWLKSANGGLFMDDNYLTHVLLPGRELVVVISMERMAEIRIANQEVMWATPYKAIQGITSEKEGIRIKLKSQSEYFIPISDVEERKSTYKAIALAVTEFNKYCEAVL